MHTKKIMNMQKKNPICRRRKRSHAADEKKKEQQADKKKRILTCRRGNWRIYRRRTCAQADEKEINTQMKKYNINTKERCTCIRTE